MTDIQLSLDEILALASKVEAWYPETGDTSLNFYGTTDRHSHRGYCCHPRSGITISIGKTCESYGHQPSYPQQHEYSIWCEQEESGNLKAGHYRVDVPHAFLGKHDEIFDQKGNPIEGTGQIRSLYNKLKEERDQREEKSKLAQEEIIRKRREEAVRKARDLLK